MARIRTVKPEFWEDEKLADIPMQARLLFIATWNFADDQGVVQSSTKYLKSKIFPYDESLREHQVKTWIDALVNARMLIPFIHDNKGYFFIRTFQSHQLIDKRYTKYIVPTKIVAELLAGLTKEENTLLTHGGHAENTSRKGRVEDMEEEVDMEGKDRKIFEDLKIEILNSQVWMDDIRLIYKVESVFLLEKINEFLNDIWLKKDFFKGLQEVREHFINWLKLELKKVAPKNKTINPQEVTWTP